MPSISYYIKKEIDKIFELFFIYLKKGLMAVGFIYIAYLFFSIGAFFLITAIFFSLAYLKVLVLPAVFSGLISVAIGLILFFLGLIIMRR